MFKYEIARAYLNLIHPRSKNNVLTAWVVRWMSSKEAADLIDMIETVCLMRRRGESDVAECKGQGRRLVQSRRYM